MQLYLGGTYMADIAKMIHLIREGRSIFKMLFANVTRTHSSRKWGMRIDRIAESRAP